LEKSIKQMQRQTAITYMPIRARRESEPAITLVLKST
jgi:hypothetical protein